MHARRRFWFEAALASIAGLLALLTAIWPVWIEGLTGLDPDRGNGSLEVLVTLLFAAVAIVSAMAARLEWRRARAVTARS